MERWPFKIYECSSDGNPKQLLLVYKLVLLESLDISSIIVKTLKLLNVRLVRSIEFRLLVSVYPYPMKLKFTFALFIFFIHEPVSFYA